MTGLFISFEGPDGGGKSTQIDLVAEWLTEKDIAFIRTREPGGTKISDHIRNLLLDPEHREMADETEILLYAASRAQLVNDVIAPALNKGLVVLSDRYVDASYAYQGFGLQHNLTLIETINRFATGGILPDRTYLLDIPVEVGLERIQRTRGLPDRIEQKQRRYHERVREGFLTLAKAEPERFRIIDASETVDVVFRKIRDDLTKLLSKKGGNVL